MNNDVTMGDEQLTGYFATVTNTRRAFLDMMVVDDRARVLYPNFDAATDGSAGTDLRAMLDEELVLEPNQVEMVGAGIAVWVKDPNLAAFILPRSGLGHKHGIVLGNLVGLIDSDYQGELKISVWNRSKTSFTIKPGDRIAQLVVMPVFPITLKEVEAFNDSTQRSDGGFGHSGQK